MTEYEKQKLISAYNALNLVEVRGISNLNNMAGSLNIISELLKESEENQTTQEVTHE